MSNLEQVKKEELETLSENDEVYDLETLILEGEKARIPIQIDYPKGETTVPVTAILKPITNVEVQNALAVTRSVRDTTLNIEILKVGLFTKNNEPFPQELLYKMPTGVVDAISEKLMAISGVRTDKESENEIVEKLLGF